MYIFKNAFKSISTYKTRNILLFVIVFIMACLCCMSLIVWQAAKQYEDANTSLMNIAVDFGTDISQLDANNALVLYEGLGTSISAKMPIDPDGETLEELHKFTEIGSYLAAYDFVNTHLRGSENFKSYALEEDDAYLTLTKGKTATAFSDHQYVNLLRYNSEEFLQKAAEEFFSISEGSMFEDNILAYQCIVDVNLANERGLQIGDKIALSLNSFQYELEITGIYTSSYIENYLNRVMREELIAHETQPSFFGEPNYDSTYYFPSIYINLPFYEEIRNKRSVGLDLDFNIVGVPSDEAMVDFISGDKSIAYGKVLDPSSDSYECMISEALARKNKVNVGDEIILRAQQENSSDYYIKIVGIYHDSSSDLMESMSYLTSSVGFYSNNVLKVPLDTIYMSFSALTKIIEDIDSYSSNPYPKLVSLQLVFKDTNEMNNFYRNTIKQDYSMRTKFQTASKYADEYFSQLAVIKRTTSYAMVTFVVELIIAILFLLMFNTYNMRERQYEIGVLTSMGMAKWKIALQFFSEIVIVVLTATLLGSGLGTLASRPVGDYLTKQSIESREDQKNSLTENFGREVSLISFDNSDDPTIDASISTTSLLWLWAAFVIVTIVSTSGVILFILSFEPIAILNDR